MFIFRSASQSEILQAIDRLNADPNVHGIIVQMPLDCDDKTIDSHLVTNRVESGEFINIYLYLCENSGLGIIRETMW